MGLRVYLLPLPAAAQPAKSRIQYPAHNRDYGVEQDFLRWLKQSDTLTEDPLSADWHYLPAYWTRYHLNHNYGKSGLEALQQMITKSILDDHKTFTICQYDQGPMVELGNARLFLSSRQEQFQNAFDIPLLCSPHKLPLRHRFKEYKIDLLASFTGKLNTHPLRQELYEGLKHVEDIEIIDGNLGESHFVRQILRSHAVLCPRGVGGDSFRFYEAMALGRVPVFIGSPDCRPFKSFLDWNRVSLYCEDPSDVPALLEKKSRADLITMGSEAQKLFDEDLGFQKWCPYVLKELEALS